ncbi:MAG: hypothetical protein LYZ70_01590 [Nitrososphaerales archaeon]|nr:hypothetical protein [Nitrososphaerales archaeon]
METEVVLASKDRAVRLWALTIFGVVFESIIGTAFVVDAYNQLTLANLPNPSPISGFIPSFAAPLFLAYSLIPIPYCWLVSRSLKPKRMVSPLNIQLFSIAAVVVGYIMLYTISTSLYSFANFNLEVFLSNTAAIGLFLGTSFIVIGLAQTQAVKLLLGLNGTADDIDLDAWPVDTPFSAISNMIDGDFLNHYGFRLKKRNEKLILLRYLTYDKHKIVVGFTPDPDDPSKSILAASGYIQGYYSINRLDTAKEKRNRVVKDLQNRLREIDSSLDFGDHPLNQTLDLASEEVKDYSLEATEAGTSALARVRRSILLTIALPIVILVLLAVPWAFHLVSTDLVGSSIILYIFTLVTVYYPEIKEKVSKP